MKLYCVKIRQRRFPDKTYFPFERLYFVPNAFVDEGHWRQIFEHMLVVESPDTLLKMLKRITVNRKMKIDDAAREPQFVGSWKSGWSPSPPDLPNLDEHRIVIPTFVHKKNIGYMWSYLKTATMNGLELSLYLPDRVIPSICYLCANLSHKYAGECTPSTEKCRSLIQIDVTTKKEA